MKPSRLRLIKLVVLALAALSAGASEPTGPASAKDVAAVVIGRYTPFLGGRQHASIRGAVKVDFGAA
jgi:hypothetical protein